jgi:uncharacterized membrane protein YbhN (UPF0104 family)
VSSGRGWRPAVSFLPALLVTAGGIYFALRGIELDAVGDSLGSSDYSTMPPALLLLALAVYLRVVRWRLLFSASTRPAFGPATEALLIGHFFNNVLPVRAGEIIRIVSLHARAGTSRAETLATIVVERAFDVLALLVLFFATLPWLPHVSWVRGATVLAVGLSIALAVAVLALARYGVRPVRFFLLPLARLPFVSVARVESGADSLVRGVAALRDARMGVATFSLTVASWLVFSVSFWLVLIGFDRELPLSAGVLVAFATGLALALPSGPAALGVFEAAVVLALTAYAVPRSEALSAALVIHAFSVVPFLAAGAVVLVARGGIGPGLGMWRLAGNRPEGEAEGRVQPVERSEERDEAVVKPKRAGGDVVGAEQPARDEPAESSDRVDVANVLDLETGPGEERP